MQTTLNDFIIQDYGKLVGFYPTNSVGRKWWHEKARYQSEATKCVKRGCFYLVDRRYARDIISGIEKDLED